MNKYNKPIVTALILLTAIVFLPSIVKAETVNGGDDVVASNTTNGSDDVKSSTTNSSDDVKSSTTNGSDDVAKSSTSNGSDDVKTTPSTSGSNNTSSGSAPVATSNSGSSPYSSGGHSGINRLAVSSDCAYITTYMKLGAQNDIAEVIKLKTFLNSNEGFKLELNGIFDINTSNAIKTFQSKYASDIMAPWGITTPTGNVFYTTQNKINELVCKKAFSLTPAQLASINAYKNGDASTVATITNPKTDTKSDTTIVTKDSKNDTQTASTANTSVAGKIWKFVKWLFGY